MGTSQSAPGLSLLFPPDRNFVAVWIVKVRKLALGGIAFGGIGQQSFTFHRQQAPVVIFNAKYHGNTGCTFLWSIGFFRMDAKGKQAGGGVEFAVISAMEFFGLD